MNTCNLIIPTNKKNCFLVPPPPGYNKPACLPHRLALTIALIINAGSKGISSLDLMNEGLRYPSEYVGRLRALGAIIDMEFRNDTDWNGWAHTKVAHYTFKGVAP